jgi:asparagine synthase (glutamine-hydrolysing)
MPLHPDFLRRSGIVRHMRRTEPGIRWFSARTPKDEQLATLMPGISAAGAFIHEIGSHYGVELRDPTADLRLVEYCMGIPNDQYFRNGERRWLMRRAADGRLPPAVQWNTRRGIQSGDMARLALGDLERIGRAVAVVESSPAARKYLSMPLLRRLWADLQQSDSALAQGSVYYLFGMLSVGLFLIREEGEAMRRAAAPA